MMKEVRGRETLCFVPSIFFFSSSVRDYQIVGRQDFTRAKIRNILSPISDVFFSFTLLVPQNTYRRIKEKDWSLVLWFILSFYNGYNDGRWIIYGAYTGSNIWWAFIRFRRHNHWLDRWCVHFIDPSCSPPERNMSARNLVNVSRAIFFDLWIAIVKHWHE